MPDRQGDNNRRHPMPEPSASQDADPKAPTDETSADETSADETPEADGFVNRAARRARGKGTSQPLPPGKTAHFGRRGTVQGPRQWGNRRSG
jgi:hypothetical protein